MSTPSVFLDNQFVNTQTTATEPKIVALTNGNFVVLWTALNDTGVADAPGTDIVGRYYDALGNPIGEEFIAVGSSFAEEGGFEAAALPDGGFVVAYESIDVDGTSIRATEVSADGEVGDVRSIQSAFGTGTFAGAPSISVNVDGSYLVTYQEITGSDVDTNGRVVDNTGTIHSEQHFASGSDVFADGEQETASATLSNSNYVVVSRYDGLQSDSGLTFRLANSAGSPTGAVQIVEGTNDLGEINRNPSVAALNVGGFVIAWSNTDASDTDIQFARYDNAGNLLDGPVHVSNSGIDDDGTEPEVTALDDGGFFITWVEDSGFGTASVRGQRYDSVGSTVGTEVEIDAPSYITDYIEPDVTILADGRIAIAWQALNIVSAAEFAIYDPRDPANTVHGDPNTDQSLVALDEASTVTGGGPNGDDPGNSSDDKLYAVGVGDELLGQNGDDILFSGNGADVLNGGEDTDIASYKYADAGVVVDLGLGTSSDGDQLIDIEGVHGSDFNDTIQGDDSSGVFKGGLGSDVITALNGNDQIILSESAVGDLDIIDGGDSFDYVDFSEFDSAVWADLDHAGVEAWTRDDDDLSSGAWREIADLSNIEGFQGSAYDDFLSGDDNFNMMQGGLGSDTLEAEGGDDALFLSESAVGDLDILNGGDGLDFANFESFDSAVWIDMSYAGAEVWTKDGHDLNSGSWRAIADLENIEYLIGSEFDDFLSGDENTNFLGAGEGNDLIAISGSNSGGPDYIDGNADTDTVTFTGFDHAVWVDLDYDGEHAWTRDNTDLDSGAWRVVALLGSIEGLEGSVFDDFLAGDDADNTLQGGLGSDELEGDEGHDTFIFAESAAGDLDTADGGNGFDTASFSDFDSAVWVDLDYAGANEVWTRDTTDLNSGTWREIADLENVEGLEGSAFDDFLSGNSSGNVFKGGEGNDILTGGGSNNVYMYDSINFDHDIITDFDNNGDILHFRETGLQYSDLTIVFGAFDTVISVTSDPSNSITLEGVSGGITEADFAFDLMAMAMEGESEGALEAANLHADNGFNEFAEGYLGSEFLSDFEFAI